MIETNKEFRAWLIAGYQQITKMAKTLPMFEFDFKQIDKQLQHEHAACCDILYYYDQELAISLILKPHEIVMYLSLHSDTVITKSVKLAQPLDVLLAFLKQQTNHHGQLFISKWQKLPN